jgi:putative NAD(P)-binding protein
MQTVVVPFKQPHKRLERFSDAIPIEADDAAPRIVAASSLEPLKSTSQAIQPGVQDDRPVSQSLFTNGEVVMKIAIVGAGISGMVAAFLLHRKHDVTVFEAADYIGGHTNTITVDWQGTNYDVDTGFIVFNDWTYPRFIQLLDRLGVESQPSEMGFSVRCERTGLEYGGTTLNTLFAQRRNILRPAFHRMIRDILRFNREAPL